MGRRRQQLKFDTWISKYGAMEIDFIRATSGTEPTGGSAPIELLARIPSEDCGCPEELWRINGMLYMIHLEAIAGTGEIFIFAGDWESETMIEADSIDSLRARMFQMVADAQEELGA